MTQGKKSTYKERMRLLANSAVERRRVFVNLVRHLKAGYSLDCFSELSENSIREFLKTYPEEFVWEEVEQALRDGKSGWENLGRRQADGTCLGNSRSWYYNMVNRYKWRERVEVDAEVKGSLSVNVVNYAPSPVDDNP